MLTDAQKTAFDKVLLPLADFKRAFGRDATPGFLAELYASGKYNLTLLDSVTAPGADASDAQGRRYQVKLRSPDVLNVDINTFDFDYIVLVNIDTNYALAGMWRLGVEQVRGLSARREKFRKFQVTQARFKAEAAKYETPDV